MESSGRVLKKNLWHVQTSNQDPAHKSVDTLCRTLWRDSGKRTEIKTTKMVTWNVFKNVQAT